MTQFVGQSGLKQSTVAWQPSLVTKVFSPPPNNSIRGTEFSSGGRTEARLAHLYAKDLLPIVFSH